jgi:hypothetical protein
MMTDFRWDQIIIYTLALVLGIGLGHAQERHWGEYEIEALKKQIERQKCSDAKPFLGKGQPL